MVTGLVIGKLMESIGLGVLCVGLFVLIMIFVVVSKILKFVVNTRKKVKEITVGDVIDGTKKVGDRALKNVRNTKIFK